MEEDLETWARETIFQSGGLMVKWVAPGLKGPPDNIVFWPGQIVHFLEFKYNRANPDRVQQEFHKKLYAFGHVVKIPRSRDWILKYINEYAPCR